MIELLRAVAVMTIAGSVLALVLFALKPLIKNRLPKTAQYYLWLVVLAALLLPMSWFVTLPQNPNILFFPGLVSGTVEWNVITAEEEEDRVSRALYDISPEFRPTDPAGISEMAKSQQSPISSIVSIFTVIYPIGAAAVLMSFLVSYRVYSLKLRRRRVPTDISARVRVYRCANAATPMLIGVFRPAIILPDREYSDEQLQSVILHETTHLRRKDVLIKWLSVIACAVHWFNPVVWLVRREIDRACELACDEAVIRNLDADGKQSYGDTLIAVAADSKMPRTVLSTTMCERKRSLKERLGAIMAFKKRGVAAAAISLVLIVGAVFTVCVLGAGTGKGNGAGLIEMRFFVTDRTEYSGVPHIEWEGRVYSPDSSLADGDAMKAGLRGREIGYAPDGDYKYRIFECKGYAPEEYIVAYYDVIMSTYEVFKADPTSSSILRETPQRYVLANGDTFNNMPTVTLFEAGTARLSQPMISSSMLGGDGLFMVAGDELTVSQDGREVVFRISDGGGTLTIKASTLHYASVGAVYRYLSRAESDAGYERAAGEPLTLDALRELGRNPGNITRADFDGYERFVISPDDYLLYIGGEYSARVRFDADSAASCKVERLSSGETFPLDMNGSTGRVFEAFLGEAEIPKYTPRKWLDLRENEKLWGESREITLPEFPGVKFTWTSEKVTDGVKDLFGGMPVWNVFFADLTNDGLPELCATVSMGSGIVDTHVVVCDYAMDKIYHLSRRMTYDYSLSMENGRVMVTQTWFNGDGSYPSASGALEIVNGALRGFGELPRVNGFRVEPSPDKWSFMSSVPGIMLYVSGEVESGAKMLYECESGELLTMYDGKTSSHGRSAEFPFYREVVYWSPGGGAKSGDRVVLRLFGADGGALMEQTLLVNYDSGYYSLGLKALDAPGPSEPPK